MKLHCIYWKQIGGCDWQGTLAEAKEHVKVSEDICIDLSIGYKVQLYGDPVSKPYETV
jgi:hypothetical protein